MIFEIYEEDLVEAGFDLEEKTYPAAIERDHMLVIGTPGDITVRIFKDGQRYRVEIPVEVVTQIQFEDSTYEHPLPAYIETAEGRISLIFP
ncbi:hypothetical protein FGU65_03815 [Methanoculleus sp. FWC-SCC1]|uniref:Uncharacterized protein n=1 Tax=Methanoculleus frigidifontis TaxID=2584085 RepID=A0ABT8M7X3_9EURY|nr:hypothetical protein [Methanoculleus sp. FWC-SCC1]MDN7024025.1 hypothetical protein [Methanoculleus sp. FWC-SCC1]